MDCIHGFRRGRSPVTNARAHIGFRYTLSMDLSDFFDHVTVGKIASVIGAMAAAELVVDGAARQGLPSSPAVANMVAAPMDAFIEQQLRMVDPVAVYTRYADDLTISSNDLGVLQKMQVAVDVAVTMYGFVVNHRKTHIQCADAGRRMITGVAVGPVDIHCPREIKRRLRAANHRSATAKHKADRLRARDSARGLSEWSKLKLPRIGREARAIRHQLHIAAKYSIPVTGVANVHHNISFLERLKLRLWCILSRNDYEYIMQAEREKLDARCRANLDSEIRKDNDGQVE